MDKGKTGTNTKKRVAFQKMIKDAEDGKIDKILVKSISRFGRNTVDLLSTIRNLRQLGIGVLFEKENLDTSNLESELLLTVYAAFAQEESLSISENMRGGMRQRFKLGIPKVSQVYGFDNIERGVLSVNEEKAEVVKRIYQMCIDDNTAVEIANTFNKEGIKPPIATGAKWYPTSIRCIIRNEKYIGDSHMQKYYTSNHFEHTSALNKELIVEQYYKEGTHEAIVSRDMYIDANQVIMMRDSARGAYQYPYYGKILCPYCKKPMVKVSLHHGRKPTCWICGGENKGELYEERTNCPIYWVKDPYLSNSVINAIMKIDIKDLNESDVQNVLLIKEQLKIKPAIEFNYLKKLIKYITFKDWKTMKVMWVWGKKTLISYEVESAVDYPDPTIDGNCIGPFALDARRFDQITESHEKVKQIIKNTRIVADTSRLYPCPPYVISGNKAKKSISE